MASPSDTGRIVTAAPIPAIAPPLIEKEPGKKDDRIGQTLRLPPGAHKQLKQLAVDVEKPMHDLPIEAVNDLFTKYGKPPIARLIVRYLGSKIY